MVLDRSKKRSLTKYHVKLELSRLKIYLVNVRPYTAYFFYGHLLLGRSQSIAPH